MTFMIRSALSRRLHMRKRQVVENLGEELCENVACLYLITDRLAGLEIPRLMNDAHANLERNLGLKTSSQITAQPRIRSLYQQSVLHPCKDVSFSVSMSNICFRTNLVFFCWEPGENLTDENKNRKLPNLLPWAASLMSGGAPAVVDWDTWGFGKGGPDKVCLDQTLLLKRHYCWGAHSPVWLRPQRHPAA